MTVYLIEFPGPMYLKPDQKCMTTDANAAMRFYTKQMADNFLNLSQMRNIITGGEVKEHILG